ncbi:MAG: hypothetical protein M3033_00465 [Acidobacteriota bacterium]|nr:hypothetical protein [Acidobacteriota bacterium]
MPNGKGQLDCCYCTNWQSEYQGSDGIYEKGFCKLYKSEIPMTLPSGTHRICLDFTPNQFYEKYAELNSIEQRFSRFETNLEKGILYGFPYNLPSNIVKIKNLTE